MTKAVKLRDQYGLSGWALNSRERPPEREAEGDWAAVGRRRREQREQEMLSFRLPGEAGPAPWPGMAL